MCLKLGVIIADNQNLFNKLEQEKQIPVDEILKVIDVKKRKIKANKKFIITVSLLLRSNLTTIRKYILTILEEERRNGI
jgi:RNA polymerase sigma factor